MKWTSTQPILEFPQGGAAKGSSLDQHSEEHWPGGLNKDDPRARENPGCRGIVTADVLELGLSRGAIATRKLEGVKWDKEHEGLYWFSPLRWR